MRRAPFVAGFVMSSAARHRRSWKAAWPVAPIKSTMLTYTDDIIDDTVLVCVRCRRWLMSVGTGSRGGRRATATSRHDRPAPRSRRQPAVVGAAARRPVGPASSRGVGPCRATASHLPRRRPSDVRRSRRRRGRVRRRARRRPDPSRRHLVRRHDRPVRRGAPTAIASPSLTLLSTSPCFGLDGTRPTSGGQLGWRRWTPVASPPTSPTRVLAGIAGPHISRRRAGRAGRGDGPHLSSTALRRSIDCLVTHDSRAVLPLDHRADAVPRRRSRRRDAARVRDGAGRSDPGREAGRARRSRPSAERRGTRRQ